MNKERLAEMVELLRKIDEDRTLASMFDLGAWLEAPTYAAAKRVADAAPEEKIEALKQTYEEGRSNGDSCGTSACAMGFACLHPPFIAQGLTYIPHMGIVYTSEEQGKRWTGFEAAADFFGIDYDDAYNFFAKTRYSTYDKTSPWQVADRIEQFIKTNL